MKQAEFKLRLSGARQSITLNTEDVKVLLLRSETNVTRLAKKLGVSRENLSGCIHGRFPAPKIRKVLIPELERLAAKLQQRRPSLVA